MQVIVGFLIVFASILGGYSLHHGHIGVLLQWAEFLIIGGAAIGAFVVGNPTPVIKGSVARLLGLLKPNPYDQKVYADLLQMVYEIMQIAARDRCRRGAAALVARGTPADRGDRRRQCAADPRGAVAGAPSVARGLRFGGG